MGEKKKDAEMLENTTEIKQGFIVGCIAGDI
jgi:hypothetical protein